MTRSAFTIGLVLLASLSLVSCQMGRSSYMTAQQRKQIETAYDSLQQEYKTLMGRYESNPDSMPNDMQSLYSQMQQMHSQMEATYRRMMSGNTEGHMQQGNGNHMMGNGMMGMRRQMMGHRTGEWYQQMMSMHDRLAAMHQRMGQQSMARMNRRLSGEFEKMTGMLPGRDEPSDVPFNEEGDPSVLNGQSLFTQNCASCHGSDAAGIAGAFPPLVNSEWVTGPPEVPVRILLNGLTGELKVNGQTYNGIMPSFKARLSTAEIAAILNYLRSQSDEELPEISQEEVVRIGKKYRDRTRSWQASELRSVLEGDAK